MDRAVAMDRSTVWRAHCMNKTMRIGQRVGRVHWAHKIRRSGSTRPRFSRRRGRIKLGDGQGLRRADWSQEIRGRRTVTGTAQGQIKLGHGQPLRGLGNGLAERKAQTKLRFTNRLARLKVCMKVFITTIHLGMDSYVQVHSARTACSVHSPSAIDFILWVLQG